MQIKQGSRILFQGDSITDCSRDRADKNSLSGYTAKINTYFQTFDESLNIECYNRGVSGNRTPDLLARLEQECAEIKPDIISVLIGINDVWRFYDSGILLTSAQFEINMRQIITICKSYAQQVIILEPFLLPSDPAKMVFYDDLCPKQSVIKKLCLEQKVSFLPLEGIFAEQTILAGNPSAYSEDGIHPNDAGNALIAREWLSRVTR